ncbi:MAG TPA: response regulator transcription factor [Anaerolineae bacterium]
MTIKVLIVDDHAVVRQGLQIFLGLDPEIEIVGEAVDGRQACALARKCRPDVVLMDLIMPVMDGIAATIAIRKELPHTEVIALTSAMEDDLASRAIKAGAIGYLLKDTDGQELRRAIKSAVSGQLILSPRAITRLLRDFRPPVLSIALTEREKEVLTLMARGYPNKQIAEELHISDPTVKSHIGSILSKLGVASRTQAVLVALRQGLVSLEGADHRVLLQ